MLSPTNMIRDHLIANGPATRWQLAEILDLHINQVRNATQGLIRRGDIEGGPRVGNISVVYSIAASYVPKPAIASIVRTALASQPELARVWM